MAGATRFCAMSPAPIKPQRKSSDFRLQTSNLELQFDGHLHLPLGGAAERTRRTGQHRRDRAEGRVAQLPVWIRELRVVENVKDLEPQFRLYWTDLRVLDRRDVDVELARAPHGVPAGVAE